MNKIFYTLVIALLLSFQSQAQLVINEVSNGPSGGDQEYVEFVVTGSCGSTVDISGFIFDDSCVNPSGQGNAPGAARFAMDSNWQNVPAGSIIVVYNSSDPNSLITSNLSDDPTDANCDGIYVVPSSSTMLESHATRINGCGDPSLYTTPTYSPGLVWSTIGLRNGGDLMQVRDASGNFIMAVAYGSSSTGNMPEISFSDAGGGNRVFRHIENDPFTQGNWSRADASAGSPGYPNSDDNATWIENFRGVFNGPFSGCADESTSASITDCSSATQTFDECGSPDTKTYSHVSSNTAIGTVTGATSNEYAITAVADGMVGVTSTISQTHTALADGPNTTNFSPTPKSFDYTVTYTITSCSSTCPDLSSAPGDVTVTDSQCGTGCTISGGLIEAPANGCPTGSTLEYSEDGTSWSTTLPTYAQEGPEQTIQTRCTCDTDDTMSSPASGGVTTVPAQQSTPVVTCSEFSMEYSGNPQGLGPNTPDGDWRTVGSDNSFQSYAAGSYFITVDLSACVTDDCSAIEDLEYSLESSTGVVNADCSVTITNNWNVRNACGNIASELIVTNHTIRLELDTAPGDVSVVDSQCDADCNITGGTITAPTTTCPEGSTLEYTVDGGSTWSSTVPTYDQTTPQTIQTRCTCNINSNFGSPLSAGVTTAPAACTLPSAPMVEDLMVCEGDDLTITPGGGTGGTTSAFVITGIGDGDLSGGLPKIFEFYALQDIADLSIYGLELAANGNPSSGSPTFNFPADAVSAGTYITVTRDASSFMDYFGFNPTYIDNIANVNGDDAVILYENGVAVDVYGDVGTDGTDEPWEYKDGWAYRNVNTDSDGTFVLANWTIENGAFDGAMTNSTANPAMPLGTFSYSVSSSSITYNFYDADPATGSANLLAGPTDSYDPMTTVADSPQSIFVTAVEGNCESEATEVVVTVKCCLTPDFMVVSPVTNSSFSNGGAWEAVAGGFEANGYCGGGCQEDVETWLIVGPLDMTSVTMLDLTVSSMENFGVTTLDFQFTTDEAAKLCPDMATWTSVQTLDDEGEFMVDFSAAMGMTGVYIGIEYSDDGVDGYSRWTLTDLELVGDECPVPSTAPTASLTAGDDMIVCGTVDVQLNGTGTGEWSGGMGAFSDVNDPTAIYTPDVSEVGTTVVLSYSTTIGVCNFSDEVNLTIYEDLEDPEFFYDRPLYCQSEDNILPRHISGTDILYCASPEGLVIDELTGEIDAANSTPGTYTITNTSSSGANLMITGIIDGPLPGGTPKAVEFYAISAIADLSEYGLIRYNNGNPVAAADYTFPSMSVCAGTYITITNSFGDYLTYFGEAADLRDGIMNHNGDDSYELTHLGQVVDAIGNPDVDGSGTTWDYLDGWVYRMSDAGLSPVFDEGQWMYSGTNSLDGSTENTDVPFGTFTTSASGSCGSAISSFDLEIINCECEITCPDDIVVMVNTDNCEAEVDIDVPALSGGCTNMVISEDCETFEGEIDLQFSGTEPTSGLLSTTVSISGVPTEINGLIPSVEVTLCVFGDFGLNDLELVRVFDENGIVVRTLGDELMEDCGSYCMTYSISNTEYTAFAADGQIDFILSRNRFVNPICPDQRFTASVCIPIVEEVDPILVNDYNNTEDASGLYPLGETTVTYTTQNIFGEESMCSFTVTVEDLTNPILECPGNATFLLDGGVCEQFYSAVPKVIGTCNNSNLVADENNSFDAAGDELPVGQHSFTYYLENEAGDIVDGCTWTVTVLPSEQNGSSLVCNDNVNISVDAACDVYFEADMFLEGSDYGCYNSYQLNILENDMVTVKPGYGDVGGETVNMSDFVGQELIMQVVDLATGNSCWGTFTLEDKIAPLVECPCSSVVTSDCRFQCTDINAILNNADEKMTPKPFYDADANCGVITQAFSDELDSDDCGTSRIYRTWLFTDASGNTSECTQTFEFESVNLFDIRRPLSPVELDCGADLTPAAIEAVAGPGAGYPYVISQGEISPVVDNVCNIYTTYTDTNIEACGEGCYGNSKVIRTWTVLDWCLQRTRTYVQIIKSVDQTPPTFLVKDTTVSTRPWDCTANFVLPRIWELHDNCDGAPTYTVTGPAGTVITPVIDGTGKVIDYTVAGAPKGDHTFTYTAVDCCGNPTSHDINVSVVDLVAPVVTTKQDIVVSLVPQGSTGDGFDGQAKLFPYHIDNGSYDMCTEVHLEIRRADGAPACGNLGVNGYNNNETFDNTDHNADDDEDTDGGQFVKFCCDDITNEATVDANGDGAVDDKDQGYVEVILRVWDDADMNGEFGTDGDNYNESWAFVKVENKLPPVLACPEDATIYCDWPIDMSVGSLSDAKDYDFSHTGAAEAYGICGPIPVKFRDYPDLNDCGIGTIKRIWQAEIETPTGPKVVKCEQIIKVEARDSAFEVIPPSKTKRDWDSCVFDETMIPDSHKPNVKSGACDVIGENIKVDTFLFEDGVCKKWAVTYKYWNWCTDVAWPETYTVYYFYDDKSKPEFEECKDQIVEVGADCTANVEISTSAVDDGGCVDGGWLKYQLFVDSWADGTVDFYASSYSTRSSWKAIPKYLSNGSLNAEWSALPAGNNYADVVYTIGIKDKQSGDKVSVNLGPIEGSMSNHKVKWKVTDGCHNFASCSYNVMVVDNKPPTPYCVDLSTALMAGDPGMVELWAIDFDKGAFDNCTPQDWLAFSFYGAEPQLKDTLIKKGSKSYPVNRFVPHYFDENNTFVDFVSDGVTPWTNGIVYPKTSPGTINAYNEGLSTDGTGVQIWRPGDRSSGAVFTEAKVWSVDVSVWDEKCNTEFCTVTLNINGPSPGSRVGGEISMITGEGVKDAQATIMTPSLAEYPKSDMSASTGSYMFNDTPMDFAYTISAKKEGNFRDGLSTIDLVKIQQHILGKRPFTTAYEVIAADIDGNETVNPSDLLELRKLILNLQTEVEGNTAWKVIDAKQTFADILNPWPLQEEISTGMLTAEMTDADFTAIKVGDLNGSYELRNATPVTIVTADRAVEAGEVVSLEMTSEEFASVYGTQFTLELNGLSYAGIEGGAMTATEANVGVLNASMITFSATAPEGLTAGSAEGIFTMNFVAERSGLVSEMISLSSRTTTAEIYVGEDLEIRPVELGFRNEVETGVAAFELLQNEPNPFKESTVIGFRLPEAGTATVTITDVTGQMIFTKDVDGVSGYNQALISNDDVSVSGVLYYTVKSGDFTATKKMISIK